MVRFKVRARLSADGKLTIEDPEAHSENMRNLVAEWEIKVRELCEEIETADLERSELVRQVAELTLRVRDLKDIAREAREAKRNQDTYLPVTTQFGKDAKQINAVFRVPAHTYLEAGKIAGTVMYEMADAKYQLGAVLASKGGNGRATKYDQLKKETIRLYELGEWKSVPLAAHEITPKIVALSKNGNGDLFSTTTKPLEWIREYRKSLKNGSN